MPARWLSSLAWTLPASKLVLIATLALRHGRPFAARDLLALLPEAGLAALLTLLARVTERRRAARALLALLTIALALATWVAAAAWAFAGAPVPFALLARLLLDAATLRTALSDPALLPQLVGWLGGIVVLWALVALSLALLRLVPLRVPHAARSALLAACVLAGLVAATRGTPPSERALALAVALRDGAPGAQTAALDPRAAAELAPPRRAHPSAAPGVAPPRNVVVLVLESLRHEPGTDFIDGFPDAVHFTRAYAHHPRSVKTLEALLFGLYPSPGLLSAAWAIDRYDVDSLALPRVLAAHGFESHYFSAMSLGFDNYGGALAAAGFDTVEVVSGGEALTWGAAAPRLLDRVAETLERGAARGARQLLVAWTAECHMPYDHSGELVPEGDPRARYLRCQQALARDVRGFLDRLEGDGLLQQTLVAVLGDHGQIFSSEKPGEVGHGTRVHEESLHIPLLLFVPGEPPRRDERLFQPVDVPATIVARLGLEPPAPWVGRDMLDRAAPGRRFVVALGTLSDGHAAVIDAAGRKIVLPGHDAAPLAFDLTRDPREQTPSPPGDGDTETAEARIATYERVAASGWERLRREDGGGPYAFDARTVAARWAPGPCVGTRVTPRDELLVEPVTTGFCAATGDPFERRLLRAFDAAALASGLRLSLTIALPEAEASPRRRALAKIWGREQVFAAELDAATDGFQTVSLTLPGPPPDATSADTVLAFVGVDPPARFLLREVTVAPLDADGAQKNAH